MKKLVIILSLVNILLIGTIFMSACKSVETTDVSIETEEDTATITEEEEKMEKMEKTMNVKGITFKLTKKESTDSSISEEQLQKSVEEHPITLEFGENTVKETHDIMNLETNEFEKETKEYAYTQNGNTIIVTKTPKGGPSYDEEYTVEGDSIINISGYKSIFNVQ